MRITEKERRVLRDEVRKAFGADSKVFLFGSRVDDARRGGDIDLLVETGQGHAAVFEAQLRFLAKVKLALGEQKIDVLLDYPDLQSHPEFCVSSCSRGTTVILKKSMSTYCGFLKPGRNALLICSTPGMPSN